MLPSPHREWTCYPPLTLRGRVPPPLSDHVYLLSGFISLPRDHVTPWVDLLPPPSWVIMLPLEWICYSEWISCYWSCYLLTGNMITPFFRSTELFIPMDFSIVNHPSTDQWMFDKVVTITPRGNINTPFFRSPPRPLLLHSGPSSNRSKNSQTS